MNTDFTVEATTASLSFTPKTDAATAVANKALDNFVKHFSVDEKEFDTMGAFIHTLGTLVCCVSFNFHEYADDRDWLEQYREASQANYIKYLNMLADDASLVYPSPETFKLTDAEKEIEFVHLPVADAEEEYVMLSYNTAYNIEGIDEIQLEVFSDNMVDEECAKRLIAAYIIKHFNPAAEL